MTAKKWTDIIGALVYCAFVAFMVWLVWEYVR